MAGLSDALTKTTSISTTLPSWYTTAQQNVANQAQAAQAPAFAATAGGQQAAGSFGAGKPFEQAAGTLQAISSGAVNPWMVTTGAGGQQTIAPDVSTPMGGLFKAQTDYLTSMMPDVSAAPTARAIGAGQYGSSANEAAVARARAQAINQLFQQQQQAALQSQQTGATAAGALGTLAGTGLKGALELAQAEQASPYMAAINQANVLSKMQQPQSQMTSEKLGALQQLSALGTMGSGLYSSIFGTMGIDKNGNPVWNPGALSGMFGVNKETSSKILPYLKGVITGGTSVPGTGTTGGALSELPNTSQPGDEAYGWTYYSDGTAVDPNGNFYRNGELVSSGWEKDPTTGLFTQSDELQPDSSDEDYLANLGDGGEDSSGYDYFFSE